MSCELLELIDGSVEPSAEQTARVLEEIASVHSNHLRDDDGRVPEDWRRELVERYANAGVAPLEAVWRSYVGRWLKSHPVAKTTDLSQEEWIDEQFHHLLADHPREYQLEPVGIDAQTIKKVRQWKPCPDAPDLHQ